MAKRLLERGGELRGLCDAHDAHRRAEPRGLHEDREPELGDRGLDRGALVAPARVVDAHIGDLREARVCHQVLEDDLVHARGRGEHPGSDVRDVEQLEQALDRAVLAERPVQDRERRVGVEQPAARAQRQLAAVVTPGAVAIQLHPQHLVSGAQQALAHGGAARKRDVVLGGPPARQHGDSHGVPPPVEGVVSGGGVKLPTPIVTFAPGLALPPLGSC